jgi:cytochrome c oxidase subunit 2
VYRGQCAEFCGIQHAAMHATVEAVPADEFDRWLADQARTQTEGSSDLGAEEFEGVCAKCHGLDGQGGIGPAINSSSVVNDKQALETTVHNGTGTMPAVGRGWSDRQTDALFAYLQKRFGQGGGGGG